MSSLGAMRAAWAVVAIAALAADGQTVRRSDGQSLAADLAVWPSGRLPDFDVLITGGTVIDGTGAPRRRADVGISGDRIAAVGDLAGRSAARVVDATGLIVAPGFIDMLGQSEFTILGDPRGVSKVTQGITTEVTGEGVSAAPVNDTTLAEDRSLYAGWGITVDWRDLDGYFRRLERSGTPINVASFVGATQVRKYVMGEVRRAPTSAELARMVALVDTAMTQGAVGLSTALVYAPAVFAQTDELIALARAAGRHGGVYATHLRDEGGHIRTALDEALRIGREADVPVEIWHLKVAGRANWGRMPRLLAFLDSLRRAGVRIGANSYPYAASATSLSSVIPAWVHVGGDTALVRRLQDRAVRARVRQQLARRYGEDNSMRNAGGPTGVLVLGVQNPALQRYEGRRLGEIAHEEHRSAYDVLFDILVADSARTGAAFFSMSEDDVAATISASWVGVDTDFGAVAPDGKLGFRTVHPRAFGTFPRILGTYVRERHLLDLETAVRKMTGVAADRFLLQGRGYLREGAFADVTIFDAERVADRATFEHAAPSEGIRYVVVNGRFTLDDGQLTGARPGRALRGPGWRPQ